MFRSSLTAISALLEDILSQVDSLISDQQFVKVNINSFSTVRMISLVNELGDQLLNEPHTQLTLDDDQEPQKAIIDNYMPINMKEDSVRIVQVLPEVPLHRKGQSELSKTSKSKYSHLRRMQSMVSKVGNKQDSAREKSKASMSSNWRNYGSDMHRLEQLPKQQEVEESRAEEEERIVQLRRQKQISEQEQKQKRMELEQKNKILKKVKNASNFDFEGRIIQVKSVTKQSLISRGVTANISDIIKCQAEPSLKLETKKGGFIQTKLVVNEKQQHRSRPARKQKVLDENQNHRKMGEIVFSEITNPLEKIQVELGVKASFNNQTVANIPKNEVSSQERAKSSLQNISRKDYQRMKTAASKDIMAEQPNVQVADRKQSIILIEDEVDSVILLSRAKKRCVTEVEQAHIQVESLELKNFLLQKQRHNTQHPKQKERPASDFRRQKYSLSRVDRHNLDYSRGLVDHKPTSDRKQQQQHILPRMCSKPEMNYPKVRERVRSGLTRREAATRFEDSLRKSNSKQSIQ